MDPVIPHDAARVALAAAEALASLADDRCPHARVLSRALSLVSQPYSAPVPSSAAAAIQKALTDVADLLQRHRLDTSDENGDENDNDDARHTVVYTQTECAVMERSVRLLWTHVTTYELHAALIHVMRTIDSLPRALVFWKHLRKCTVREIVQRGPMQWLLTRAQQITAGERIRSLSETLDAHLVRGDRAAAALFNGCNRAKRWALWGEEEDEEEWTRDDD